MHNLHVQRLPDSGEFAPGYEPRVTLHTTEGSNYPGPQVYRHPDGYVNPNFTCDVRRRVTYEHVPVNLASKALINALGGVETNRANNVQIEIVGFSALVTAKHFGHPEAFIGAWRDDDYAYLHSLLVHIKHAGHDFKMGTAVPWGPRMSADKWRRFNGICGHRHVPENFHVDPGTALNLRKVRGV